MGQNAVKTVVIKTPSSRYEAVVGRELLAAIGERLAAILMPGSRCAIVADANTGALFGAVLQRSVNAAGFPTTIITVPAGESSKSLEQVGSVCDAMAAAGLDRSSFLIALGGGVVGDLTGFAAAIYHRGISYVQVPTTLLAQVDSSIGGKTAVNTTAGKNLLGAVHQPALVLADTATLETLPQREFRQGFAEMIKHAIIADASLFEELNAEAQMLDCQAGRPATLKLALPNLIQRNIEIKATIVARDEHDTSGARAILNFGHTVGHAIERAAGYGALLHGEAVSLGIAAASEISVRRAGLPERERQRVVATLQSFDLPTRLPADFPRDAILSALSLDKKFARGQVRFVVTSQLGSARLTTDVTLDDIAAAIATL